MYRSRDAGFTMLELLVAMTVVAMMSVLAVGTLRTLARGFETRQALAIETADLARTPLVLEREVGRALPILATASGQPVVLFEGESDRLAFVNAAAWYRQPAGLIRWRVGLSDEGERTVIDIASLPAPDPSASRDIDLEELDELDPRILGRASGSLSFGYFGKRGDDEAQGWHEEWVDEPRLPRAVRLASGDGSAWLVLPLAIDTPVICARDGGEGSSACTR